MFLAVLDSRNDTLSKDDTRAWGPPYAKYVNSGQEGPGESAYYLGVSCL